MFKTASPVVKLGLSLQEHCAVFRLIADLCILIEIANTTASRGDQIFQFRERVAKLWPRIRVKFADEVSIAQENPFRTFQHSDFRSLRVDLYAAGLWQVALQQSRNRG